MADILIVKELIAFSYADDHETRRKSTADDDLAMMLALQEVLFAE